MNHYYSPQKPSGNCINCDYNAVGKSGWRCGKGNIMVTLNKILKAHKPKDMIPISYEFVEMIADKIREGECY